MLVAEIGRCSVLCNESSLNYDAAEESKMGGKFISLSLLNTNLSWSFVVFDSYHFFACLFYVRLCS